MVDHREAHVSPLANSVANVGAGRDPNETRRAQREPFGASSLDRCAACAAVLEELAVCERAIADESTEPEARVALSQVAGRIRRALEVVEVVPYPGQRWRSSTLPNVEAVVAVVTAKEVELSRLHRGQLVAREYVLRERFTALMSRRGWKLASEPGPAPRQAPGGPVEHHRERATLPDVAFARAPGVFTGEFGDGGDAGIGAAVDVVGGGDAPQPIHHPANHVGQTLAVTIGDEED